MSNILNEAIELDESAYFPIVMKKQGLVIVVYRDHSESYKFSSSYKGEASQPYDPYDEVKMARENGCKEIHGKEDTLA